MDAPEAAVSAHLTWTDFQRFGVFQNVTHFEMNIWPVISKGCVLCAHSCPTLCDPVDHSPPGSSVHGILQARILEEVAISFSIPKVSSWFSILKEGKKEISNTEVVSLSLDLVPWLPPGGQGVEGASGQMEQSTWEEAREKEAVFSWLLHSITLILFAVLLILAFQHIVVLVL